MTRSLRLPVLICMTPDVKPFTANGPYLVYWLSVQKEAEFQTDQYCVPMSFYFNYNEPVAIEF